MTAWNAEAVLTMWVLNVGKPLQQAEQAHPEGAAFMTTVWGNHRGADPNLHTLISHRSNQCALRERGKDCFVIKFHDTVQFDWRQRGVPLVTRGNITRKTKHSKQRLWANCFQTLGDIRRRAELCLSASATVDTRCLQRPPLGNTSFYSTSLWKRNQTLPVREKAPLDPLPPPL